MVGADGGSAEAGGANIIDATSAATPINHAVRDTDITPTTELLASLNTIRPAVLALAVRRA